MQLRAPFPFFGGKQKAAHLIWSALGDVSNYVEPFFGSGAILLGRPTAPRIETVNDVDAMIANFWRATVADPEAVARHALWPVNEVDLNARNKWLKGQREFRERMFADPDYFDSKIAGWWVWGIGAWIGGSWCTERTRVLANRGTRSPSRKPQVSGWSFGHGIHRQMPRVGGMGGTGVHGHRVASLLEWFERLQRRLAKTRVCCGDWTRVLTPTVVAGNSETGIVLDPPYKLAAGRAYGLYGVEGYDVSDPVRAWAIEHGSNPKLRIVLCGYEGEHEMPKDWRKVEWTANGGYANRNKGNANKHRERLWLSPACLDVAPRVEHGPLFDRAAEALAQ